MGKADYQLNGYQIFWYSNDHLPEHVNIEKRGHWGIKIYFLLSTAGNLHYEVVWQNKRSRPSSKELRLFLNYVLTYKEHLQQEWEKKVCMHE